MLLDILRASQGEWFEVPSENQQMLGIYASQLEPYAKRRRLQWVEIAPQLDELVRRLGGHSREVEGHQWSIWDVLRRRAGHDYTTTYYEMPHRFFTP